MDKNSEIELFKCFLLYNVGEAKIQEFTHHLGIDSRQDMTAYCHKTQLSSFVSSAFDWNGTPSGFDFWEGVDKSWRSMIKAHTKYYSKIKSKPRCKSIW